MTRRGFEHVEHTADLAVRAWGERLEDAFAEAARGLFAHVIDLERVEARKSRPIRVEAPDLRRLLYAFLEEARFESETGGVVFSSFDVVITPRPDDGLRLDAEAWGEAYHEERHGHYHEVKAITLHDLTVRESPPEVHVIFDI